MVSINPRVWRLRRRPSISFCQSSQHGSEPRRTTRASISTRTDRMHSQRGGVKSRAMTGSLTDRPAGLSRTQLDCARAHGDAYWLYVVERAGMDSARIVRIQDRAGNARTFTFDHGWLNIAELDSEEDRED